MRCYPHLRKSTTTVCHWGTGRREGVHACSIDLWELRYRQIEMALGPEAYGRLMADLDRLIAVLGKREVVEEDPA